jgi:Tfp pilus assembly protein PilF
MPDLSEILRRGFQCHQSGKLERAESLYRKVLKHEPRHAETLDLLGILSNEMGKPELAIRQIRSAISIQPGAAIFHLHLGLLLEQTGDLASALTSFREAVRLQPGSAEAHFRLGNALQRTGNNAETIASFITATVLNPDYAEAHNNLGVILKDEGDLKAALGCFRRAIALKPDYAEAHNNLGAALLDQGDLDGAAESHRRAIALKPDYATAHDNLAALLLAKGEVEEAEMHGRRAITLEPDNAVAWVNLGVILGQRSAAEEQKCMERAIALQPDFALAHWNLSLAQLLRGDYRSGWPEYEWRWQWKDFSAPKRAFDQPQWRGEPLNGARILLHAEQGYGDTIQMLRYVPLVAERGGRVLLELPQELQQLAAEGLPGEFELSSAGESLPSFDWHCPMMSLPLAFETTIETIPLAPYLHRFAPLHEPGQELRVGVCWAGSPGHKQDRRRSIPTETLTPLASIAGVRWISLQKESGPLPFAMETAELRSFGETATIAGGLDLVISVDTAVAHLAGALGRPTWVLLPNRPDWRWLLEREDSPWYATMRLFRQSSPGDWAGIIERVAAEVERLAARRG